MRIQACRRNKWITASFGRSVYYAESGSENNFENLKKTLQTENTSGMELGILTKVKPERVALERIDNLQP
jgi:hypothetical protein